MEYILIIVLAVLGFLSSFSMSLLAQKTEVVLNWEIFLTGTPEQVKAEIAEEVRR